MIIIPSRHLVILTPPKTASRSIRFAVLARYEDAWSPYRHMERPGIPLSAKGYDVVGIIREPRRRLFSIWHYMRTRLEDHPSDPDRSRALREDAGPWPFETWLDKNRHPFNPNHDARGARFGPPYVCIDDRTPIARRSLRDTFRPDLGEITLLPLEDPVSIEDHLDISLDGLRENETGSGNIPMPDCPRIEDHMKTWFSWDIDAFDRAMQVGAGPEPG